VQHHEIRPRRQLRGGAGSQPAKLTRTQHQKQVLGQKVYKFLFRYFMVAIKHLPALKGEASICDERTTH